MIQEPFVKVTTIDNSTLSSPIPDSLNLGMVINSDTGPVGITRVDSQSEFINKYFVTNQLNPTDDVTVKHAFKLLQFMPIYVTRAMDNSIFGGITNNGDTIFVDKDYQVMKYYKKLSFSEVKTGIGFAMMVLNGTNFDEKYAKCFYVSQVKSGVDTIDQITVANLNALPNSVDLATNDVIYDYVTEKYYTVNSVSTTQIVVAELTDITGKTIKYRARFNVTRGTKCVAPSFSDIFKIGSIVKVNSSGIKYYYVTSDKSSEWTECVKITETPGILNLFRGYNSGSYNLGDSSNTKLGKFYSLDDDGEILSAVIDSDTQLIRLAYALTTSQLVINELGIDSVYEASKYSQFSGTASGTVGSSAGEYLSVNGFTFFSEESTSSNNFYPYVTVNIGLNNPSVNRFLTYIYDYQLSHDTNIEPAMLTSTLGFNDVDSDAGLKITIDGDFNNKFVITKDNSNIVSAVELLSNNRVESGSIKFSYEASIGGESVSRKWIIYAGDINPDSTCDELVSLFDVEGNNTVHTTGKALYLLIDQLVADGVINFTEDSNSTTKLIYQTSLLESSSCEVNNITGPSPAKNNYKYSFLDDSSILGNITYEGLQLRIDDYLFYNKRYTSNDPDVTPVKLSSAPLTYLQFVKTLRRIVGNYYNCINSERGFTLMTDDPDQFSKIEYKGSSDVTLDDIIDTNNAGIVTSAKFAIINKGPSKKKFLQFSLTQDPDDPELWTLVIMRKEDESTTYTISFVEDKVDGYGRNVYYTYVNQMDDYIHLVQLEGDDPVISGTYTSAKFGDEVPIAEPEPDDYAAAIAKFNENEGIYYDFLFDGGYANMVYSKAIFEVCKNIYAEGLLTMPQITDPKQLIKYRQDCGIDTEQGWRCVMRGNWINDTTVADFLIRMSPMCAYVEKIVNNKTGMMEFAPVFGPTNGAITYDAGFYIKKKSIREDLLNNQIPILIEDKSLNLRYFNLDTTLKVVDSSLADANNCRMINIGAHICDNQCKWYIGRFNTADLRREVTNSLTTLLSNRLIRNQQYPLAGLRVICNESNNPVTVVENRELIIDVAYQFTPGIRYVNVFQKVYKLSQDLDAL